NLAGAAPNSRRTTARDQRRGQPQRSVPAEDEGATDDSTLAPKEAGNAAAPSDANGTEPPSSNAIAAKPGNGSNISPNPGSQSSPNFSATQPPAAPQTSDRVVPAHLIYRVEPFYPREALQQRLEGTVKIRATVDADGRVKNSRV